MLQGLDSALLELVPYAGHRYCVQHMYRNFKKKHPGQQLKQIFWRIASATTAELYQAALEELQKFDQLAYGWVKKAAPPEHWCKAFFPLHVKSDMLVNNLSETFNAHILNARDLPVIGMCEGIRVFLMERIQNRIQWMEKDNGLVGPAIKLLIEEREKLSRRWKPISNGKGGYQVSGPRGDQYAVFLNDRNCTCRLWQISGIPCCHAISAILKIGEDPSGYAHGCYSRQLFLQIYQNVLYPISGKSLWPESDYPVLDPPICCVQPGRPKKSRRKDVTEERSGIHARRDNVQRLRKHVIMHCSKCGQAGHNSATCKNDPQNADGTATPSTSTSKKSRRSTTHNKRVETSHATTEQNFEHARDGDVEQHKAAEHVTFGDHQRPGTVETTDPVLGGGTSNSAEKFAGSTEEQDSAVASQAASAGVIPNKAKQNIRKTKTPVRRKRPLATAPSESNPTGQSIFGGQQTTIRHKSKLSEVEKVRINVNYEYLGKEPPFKVGRWAGTSSRKRGGGGED